jgi:hypothetical protein
VRRLLARRRRLRTFTGRVDAFLPPVATPTVYVPSRRRRALQAILDGLAPRGDE